MAPEDALDKRPKAETLRVEDLLDEARRGKLRIPHFQRGLNWDDEDVRLLFDSIWRGYPIGSLLFWQRRAEQDAVRFGAVVCEGRPRSDAWWVVDGQQRVTSLIATLLAASAPGDPPARYDLYFDLEARAFTRPTARRPVGEHWLPLREIVGRRLYDWLDHYPHRRSRPDHFEVVKELARRVLEYRIPIYIVEADDEKPLRRLFSRMNTTGKPMKDRDVFHALLGAVEGERRSGIPGLAARLTDEGMGELEQDTILRALMAIRGLDVTRKLTRQPGADDKLAGALTEAEQPLRRALAFLRRDAGVPHLRLLPYSVVVTMLARFFHLHPSPAPRNRELLVRWVWRGAQTGAHIGNEVSHLRHMVKAIDDDEHQSIQRLLALLPADGVPSWSLGSFDTRSARSRIELLALADLEPRLFSDAPPRGSSDDAGLYGARGARLPLGPVLDALGADGTRSLVSSSHADGLDEDARRLRTSVAARVIHPLAGRSLVGELKKFIRHPPLMEGVSAGEVLASHAIPPEAARALVADDRSTFLRLRGEYIRALVEGEVRRRTAWDRDRDRPPLSALSIDEEVA
ncbi:MAG: DUF262 domain-containing protein [Myxococcales bacterium]|nr:DUF262 domain-containing protein [Myxococcales bacterium]